MELLADRDPEEARNLLDPVLEHMMEAVHRYEGTVNQVMGDGIMALFGAPLAHEDHAVRACYAALAMQEAIRRGNEMIRRNHGVEVQIRVGLNSGEVVVRSVNSDLHMDYSAIGHTTHLAARMEQLAAPGMIRLTAETLKLAEGFVQVTALGPMPVKGVARPVDVFELIGTTPTRTRLQVAVSRGLTRFVGRAAELGQLQQALARASRGQGQVVAVVGEPGVGKSRLFWEFAHSHRVEGWLLLESSSASYGAATAYVPLIDLLKAYFQIEARDDGRRIREKVTGKLLTLDEALRPTLAAFLTLLEVPVEDNDWQTIDAAQRRQRIIDAVKRLLLRESQVQPLCVIFEDLHWTDVETRVVLDALVESLPTARILILVNYRPEYQHRWVNKTYYTQIRLDPLPPESADELLEVLMGDELSLQTLKRYLIERTEGNPFFLEESIRALVEEGVLSGTRGAYRLAKSPENLQVPATVQALLAARIDRLPPDEKTLLQTAAVIGEDVPYSLLQTVAELSEDMLRLSLSRLLTAEFLYEAALFPEVEYTFRHALTHEVAYTGLLEDRRRTLHARIVEAFESLYPERVAERVDWLAHHAFRGEVWRKALTYLRHAGAASPLSLDAVFSGGPESAGYLWWTGAHERALKAAQRDLVIAADFGIFSFNITASFRLGQIHHALGNYAQAREFLTQPIASLEGDLLNEQFDMAGLPSVFSRAWMAICLAECGAFTEAVAHGEEGVRIAEAADHAYSLIVACFGLGTLYLLKGDLRSAIDVLERGHVLIQMKNIPLLFPFVAAPLGFAYSLSGRADEAVVLLEQACEKAVSSKLAALQALRLALLGEAHLFAGHRDRTTALAQLALQLSREQKERGHEAYALRLLGEIASREDPPNVEEAQTAYRQALALAEELGMRPLVARCHGGLGQLHDRIGNTHESQGHLATAETLARQLGMRPWDDLRG